MNNRRTTLTAGHRTRRLRLASLRTATCLLLTFLSLRAAADLVELTVWDYNGDSAPPAAGQGLCDHGYSYNMSATKDVTVESATTIVSVTFDIYYTSCGAGGDWQFFLNGMLIGTAANPEPVVDCSCTPAAVKWPLSVRIVDGAALTANWNFSGNNTLRVVPNAAQFYASYYGLTVEYETTVHSIIDPSSQAGEVGEVLTFDGSSSYSETGTIVSYVWDFGDGSGANGPSVSHAYGEQGSFLVRLTVVDDAGLSSTASSAVAITGPPQVSCIPWRFNLPHPTWNGNQTVLKAVVRDLDFPLSYVWDFGDGASVSGTIANTEAAYEVEAIHTYPASADGTPYIATLTVTDPGGLSGTDQYSIVVRNRNLDVETDVAIDDGLWWLHKQIQRYAIGAVAAGRWAESAYDVAPTAAAVLSLEVQGHRAVGDPNEDPYIETVQRGLNHLFSKMLVRSVSTGSSCPYGEPDSNGNGIGIDINSSRNTYEIGLAMMALAASAAPDVVAEVGPANVISRSYRHILQDMVDMCAWGQNASGYGRGGWRYYWNYGSSDNSVSQWPIIGLEAAEANWGIVAPDFVKRELEIWLRYSQCGDGSWGYVSPCDHAYSLPAKVGAGIAGLNYIGKDVTDTGIQLGLSYLNGYWGATGYYGLWDNYYAMYAVMKGMRTAHPAIELVGAHDWYAEFARYLVDHQQADGSWVTYGFWTSGRQLDSAFALLILTPTVVAPPPVADLVVSPLQARPGAVFTFDGSGSYHLDPDRVIVEYDFDFGDSTTYTESAASAPDGIFDGVTTHVYPDAVEDLAGMPGQRHDYVVTLTVTDDDPSGAKTDTDTEVVTLSLDNHPPVADTGGPYTGYVGIPLSLSGADSYDPDQGPPLYNHIVSYEWELDGVAPYEFDDADTMVASWTWPTEGVYHIGLRVTDRFGESHIAWTTVEIKPGIPTELFLRDRHVNYTDTVNLQGRLTTITGDPLPGMSVNFYVDMDQDGSFDPTTELVGMGVTDGDGQVLLPFTAWLDPGNYQVQGEFAGAEPYFASLDEENLRVDPEITVITYTGDLSGGCHESCTVGAVLTDDEGDPVVGVEVMLSIGAQELLGLTDGAGVCGGQMEILQPPGTCVASAAFEGNFWFRPCSDAQDFTIFNHAPSILTLTGPTEPVPVGTPIAVTATFSDADAELDVHTAMWNWADGTSGVGTVVESGGSGRVDDAHIYLAPGLYCVSLRVEDAFGGYDEASLAQWIVVYDPAGGFVTGGGWIESPAGAYCLDPALSGSANFGFISRYKKGASQPIGQTEFQFQVAELNFHSSSYDWLVVTGGGYARFKGIGTINGEGEYKFMIWAGDGFPDTFRIKIWLEDEVGNELVVYDNGADQPLVGGSIVVHQ